MIKIGIKGRILSGKYKDWYILIRPDPESSSTKVDDRMYYIYVGKSPELKGGIRKGVFNTLVPSYGSVLATLEFDGVIENGVINIEWLDDR